MIWPVYSYFMLNWILLPKLLIPWGLLCFIDASVGTDIGLSPNLTTMINSIALLGIAAISAWTAAKQANRDKQVLSIKRTGEATHTLSNSAMAAQLKMNVQFATQTAVLAHRLAESTKQEGDIAAALAADIVVKEQEAILQKHLIAQAKVDTDTARDQAQAN
jgi:hypothetical protein